MGIIELKYDGKIHTNKKTIIHILESLEFWWLIDSETEGGKIEILKNTIIWHDGLYLSGNWHYGIFKNGEFYGNWRGGIWEGGFFGGNWISGIKK